MKFIFSAILLLIVAGVIVPFALELLVLIIMGIFR